MTTRSGYKWFMMVAMFGLMILALAACGSGATAAPTTDPNVTPLTESEAAPYLAIKSADGFAPCGVFNVNGHGAKDVQLANFPKCSADYYGVQCLNDKAEWKGANVGDVSLSPDGKVVHFASRQDGICALFPQ